MEDPIKLYRFFMLKKITISIWDEIKYKNVYRLKGVLKVGYRPSFVDSKIQTQLSKAISDQNNIC